MLVGDDGEKVSGLRRAGAPEAEHAGILAAWTARGGSCVHCPRGHQVAGGVRPGADLESPVPDSFICRERVGRHRRAISRAG